MSKTLKKILVSSVSLLMFLSTSANVFNINANDHISVNTRITHLKSRRADLQKKVGNYNRIIKSINTQINNLEHKHKSNYKTSWKRGMPRVLNKKSYWIGSFVRDSYKRYVRFEFAMNSKLGIELFPNYYKNNNYKSKDELDGFGLNGFDQDYPYYQSLGHGKYILTSGYNGVLHKHSPLYYDLENGGYLLQMHGNKHLSLWHLTGKNLRSRKYNHKTYVGYYTRYPQSKKVLRKVLNLNSKY